MTRIVLTTSAVLIAACASPREAPPPASPRVAAAAPDCGPEIPGLDDLAGPHRMVMLGELHGTREIPGFVGDLVCHAARRGVTVRLGLEIPRGDAPALATYLAGSGDASARTAVLASEHWQRQEQDGRGSEAILALLERVRRLRRAGFDIDLFAFDAGDPSWTWNERDAAMATIILEQAAAAPDALVLTLSGNLHNRTVPGLAFDPAAVPMGVHVRRRSPSALSLDVRYLSGAAWVCQERCGAAEFRGSAEGEPRRIALAPAPDAHGHDGIFAVGAITAAPPAAASTGPITEARAASAR